MTKVTDYAYSLLNKRVTVPYNPYGGQCVSFVDHLATHFTGKNLAYTNAIDLLEKGKSQGFKVTYFTGSEIPKVGDIGVTATSNHPFGHTFLIVKVDKTGSYFTTLEQNVDLNGDALENGGWVREKNRTLYVDGTFTYDNDVLLSQKMIGWFTFYEEEPIAKKTEANKETEQGEEDMFIVTAKGRGIALMMGGKFLPFLHGDDPKQFGGVRIVTLDTKTFDAWQGKAEKSTLDDATVDKLIKGLKK